MSPFPRSTYNPGTDITTIVNHRVFSAYGELLSQMNPQTSAVAAVDCLFNYTGCPLSVLSVNAATGGEDGLQFNGDAGPVGRWYDAVTGRWLKRDSAGLGPDVNPYRYVGNGPTNATDPAGTDPPSSESHGWPVPGTNGSYVIRQYSGYSNEPSYSTQAYVPDATAADAAAPRAPANPNGPGYWNRYWQHCATYSINLGTYIIPTAPNGVVPKSWEREKGRVERWRGGLGFDIFRFGVSPSVSQ